MTTVPTFTVVNPGAEPSQAWISPWLECCWPMRTGRWPSGGSRSRPRTTRTPTRARSRMKPPPRGRRATATAGIT